MRFLLHGDEAALEAELARHPAAPAACEVRHTDKVIAMDEKPAQAMRRGKGSSLWNAVEAMKTGEAGAAVSAGNTGALMAISKLILRMARRPRPARHRRQLADPARASPPCSTSAPTSTATPSSWSSSPSWARPSTAPSTASAKPTIGLLNVGSEDMKGHEEVREAHRLLREGGLDLDYHGFVEGDDITKGTVDVVVTDGFTGNIALKTAEGMARFISAVLQGDPDLRACMAKLGAADRHAGALKRMRAPHRPQRRSTAGRCSA